MAIADADYRFISINVGAYGSEGDSGVFAASSIGKQILRDTLTLPGDANVYSRSLPYYFHADDAFPLCKRILKPYTPKRGASLSNEERIFNYRLSRARRCIENAFGVLSSKWLCLSRTMFCYPDKAQKIVTACCILHNFLMKASKETYCPNTFGDTYDNIGNYIPGEWRNGPSQGLLVNLGTGNGQFNRAVGTEANAIRDHVKSYCNSQEASLPWQESAVFLT